MEEEGMNITVFGATLIVVAVIISLLLIGHWQAKATQRPAPTQG